MVSGMCLPGVHKVIEHSLDAGSVAVEAEEGQAPR